MIEGLPPGVLLLLDEAYLEMAPEGTAPRIAADEYRADRRLEPRMQPQLLLPP